MADISEEQINRAETHERIEAADKILHPNGRMDESGIPYYMELDGHRIVVCSQERADELSQMGYKPRLGV